ncbi:serine/threonine protein kinase [Burkholderia sp. MSMB617WGS]|uniref:serine/threonine-protein kinase n=1 Tax=Burkholderia sp. MSMB617WGS TaxID=1637831 RepID=UPI00075FB374|nr:serine/threonine-protein kinase [Burkholderia sp. MSMB617WGS]AOK49108.1 serine/threonine protein kinase [Burkholderia sp. MSMB617WGS]
MTDAFSRDNEQETVTRSAAAEFAVRPLPLGHRLGELQLDEVLGVGGFGIVYRAFDRTLRRAVAIKEYMPSMLATRGGDYTVSLRSERFAQAFDAGRSAFLNEARLLAQFDHPGLVKVLHFWESHGTAYMVMPFYEGRTLKQLLDGGAQMGETQLRNIVAALLGALDTLHRAQCFHRDIALDNILIRPDGNPILLDFGAARKRIGDLVDDSAMMIKPGYAPIEQYTDDPAFGQGPWTDLYALGAVMHAMVAGELPPAAVVRSIKDTYRPLAARELTAREPYSPAFLAAIDHALQLKIADRPESVAEFAAELGLREFDRPPYVSPMPATPTQAQPREPEGDRDAGAARSGAEQAAASGSSGAGRSDNADAAATAAWPDGERARQSSPHRQADAGSAAAAQGGVEPGASAAEPQHRQAGDERATSARSGAEQAQLQSYRQAGERGAAAAKPDEAAAAPPPPPPRRPTDDRDAVRSQSGVERAAPQPPPRGHASEQDSLPARPVAGDASRQSASASSDGMPPSGADGRRTSEMPLARDATGARENAGAGAMPAAGTGHAAGASRAAASPSGASAFAASASGAFASAASTPGASTPGVSTPGTSAAARPAALRGDVRNRLRDRRTIAYAGGALAAVLAIGIGVASLLKPSGPAETAATNVSGPPSPAATNASAPPPPAATTAATATPAPGDTPASASVLAQREPPPALAPPPAAALADTTAPTPAPAPTVATTVTSEAALQPSQTTSPGAQPAPPQIAKNDAGGAPAQHAPAANLAPKGSLDATETVIANSPASGVAPPPATSVAAEAAAAADQRPPDMQETIPVRFRVRPWGDVYVSGVRRGASPPLRALSLAPGVYQIEIRNGTLPPLRRTVKIDPGSKPINIDYAFE